jgi:PadR family transcriptional regulator, regulatory protein PadR
MAAEPRMTLQVLRVLDTLLDGGTDDRYGFEISKITGLKSGTLYPILARLEGAGWLTSGWEAEVQPGRPRRRYYRLTGVGADGAQRELANLPQSARKPIAKPTRRPAPLRPHLGGAR